jgi:hypothetical protein
MPVVVAFLGVVAFFVYQWITAKRPAAEPQFRVESARRDHSGVALTSLWLFGFLLIMSFMYAPVLAGALLAGFALFLFVVR